MKIRALLAALVVVLVGLIAAPAGAVTKYPEIGNVPSAPPGHAAFAIQAPMHAWGIRTEAAYWASHSKGLTVYTSGSCADHPDAYCVRVVVKNFGPTGWRGKTEFYPYFKVRLNTFYTDLHQRVAGHEFGHVLGFDHTLTPGIMSVPATTVYPTKAELAAVSAWYGENPWWLE